MTWFQDAKFGIFMHWGAYSVPAWAEPIGELGTFDSEFWFAHCPYAEWYWNTSQIPGSAAFSHHQSVHGGRPYDSFLDFWRAENFDPADLASLFAGRGPLRGADTAHDASPCGRSRTAPATRTPRSPPRPRRSIADASRAAGLRFGVYYSGGIDWFAGRRAVIRHEDQIDDHGRANEAAYAAYALRHVQDLITRYSPDILWNDIGWPDQGLVDLPGLFAFYRADVPHGIVNDRWDGTHSRRPDVAYDFRTSEYQANRSVEGSGPWENCRGIGFSFGYNQAEDASHSLPVAGAVRQLADVVSRGGNLLLNVGPRADGTLPPTQWAVLEGMAEWMAVNSVAIHDTRPLDGVSPSDSPWLRWTRGGNHAYALIAETGEMRLPHLAGLLDLDTAVRLDGKPVISEGTAVTLGEIGDLPIVVRFDLVS
ncbi:alpha-L-fucosidase [Kutzneria sp. 744]|uniref:alpha-L-fucosidase n=1 Tax=Kutzneria sp. (strain 744) TaxID=345341 RepID=UPI0003EEA4BF|nr:alpha-L-fucosidase [Kutzneria sp. 744]EWM10536.1 alpha-L-fucosidase [Kutzneria sp. 744]